MRYYLRLGYVSVSDGQPAAEGDADAEGAGEDAADAQVADGRERVLSEPDPVAQGADQQQRQSVAVHAAELQPLVVRVRVSEIVVRIEHFALQRSSLIYHSPILINEPVLLDIQKRHTCHITKPLGIIVIIIIIIVCSISGRWRPRNGIHFTTTEAATTIKFTINSLASQNGRLANDEITKCLRDSRWIQDWKDFRSSLIFGNEHTHTKSIN